MLHVELCVCRHEPGARGRRWGRPEALPARHPRVSGRLQVHRRQGHCLLQVAEEREQSGGWGESTQTM